MAGEKSLWDIIFPIVYLGINEEDEAIFYNSEEKTTVYIPATDFCFERNDGGSYTGAIILFDEEENGHRTEHRFNPGDRLIFPKQRQFIRFLEKYEAVLFGGAAGGGKSRILLMAHVYYHLKWNAKGIKRVRTIMLCEDYPTLYDRQIQNIEDWIPAYLGRWYEQKKIFKFKKRFGGGQILFRSLDNPIKFRSLEFALVTIDEVTQNGEADFNELVSRLRNTKGVRRTMFGAATNPGGIGHGWVKRRFVDVETRDKPTYSERYKRWTLGHAFITCLPTENPLLGPDYYMRLEKLPPHMRDALLFGKWDAFEGQYFDMLVPGIHRIAPFRIPDEVIKFRFIDVGTHHPFVCLWAALYPPTESHPKGRLVVYREYSVIDKWANRHKKRIYEIEKAAGDRNIIQTIMSPDAWYFKGSHQSDKTIAEIFSNDDADGPSFDPVPAIDDRVLRARALANAFSCEYTAKTNEDSHTEYEITVPPFIYMFSDCRLLWKSLTNMLHDKHNPEAVQKSTGTYYPSEGDDEYDGLGYGNLMVDPSLAEHYVGKGNHYQDDDNPRPGQDRRRSDRTAKYETSGYADF